jgi:NAD+ synthase (glutamine-hydrolysing)
MKLATLATCNLDQWALDFAGNLRRIEESLAVAKAAGATLRLGPELEVPGYGCEDHFLEADTEAHGWEALAAILAGDGTVGILADIGMPVRHNGVLYNCRVVCLNRAIVLVRPKVRGGGEGAEGRGGGECPPTARGRRLGSRRPTATPREVNHRPTPH